jgi:hypothetical protein
MSDTDVHQLCNIAEEIQKITEYPDRRIKAIDCTMVSSGIRIGSWDYLR